MTAQTDDRDLIRDSWIITVPDGRTIDVLALVRVLRHIVESVDAGIYDANAFAYEARQVLTTARLLPPVDRFIERKEGAA